jgi:hypothetical protein
MNSASRKRVYNLYREKLDKRYPKGYKIITPSNTKEFFLFPVRNDHVKTLFEMDMIYFPSKREGIDGVSIWAYDSTTVSIATVNIGRQLGAAERNNIIKSEKYKKVLIDYSPFQGIVLYKTRYGNFVTLRDDTAVIVDPANDLSNSSWYLDLKTGYVDADYSDYVSQDTASTFKDFVGGL